MDDGLILLLGVAIKAWAVFRRLPPHWREECLRVWFDVEPKHKVTSSD